MFNVTKQNTYFSSKNFQFIEVIPAWKWLLK